MGRPPLPIGTYGKIRTHQTSSGWRAVAKFRDHDGVTRTVERRGRTESAAIRTLKTALRDRKGPQDGTVSETTRFHQVAELWFARIAALVEEGKRSPSTADRYRDYLDRIVLPGLGGLRMHEVTVSRVDAFLAAVRAIHGTATARTCRSVVSGVLGVAVRHGAFTTNPTRDAERIEAGRRKAPRALTPAECVQLVTILEADPTAARKDLPDLTRFMLATGVRIGETLAVSGRMWIWRPRRSRSATP